MKPNIEGAPGLIWREREEGWVAYWICRADLVKRGYHPKTVRLWAGHELTEIDAAVLREQCNQLQSDMIVWARGGEPITGHFDGTLRALINAYQTDKDSSFHKLRYHVRQRHVHTLKHVVKMYGAHDLRDIKARLILGWHKEWLGEENKVASAHMMVGQLRTLFGFGMTILENAECERLSGILGKMRFPMSRPREERLTAEQANAIRAEAHKRGLPSIALAQALQFELMLRQKDVIGEWVPFAEPGNSEERFEGKKWLRGLRWNEIDQNMILRHVTSKKGKPLEVNLRKAPMVMEELDRIGDLPATGPMIVRESTGRPWTPGEFREKWRAIARAVGVPDAVRNMDSRAGGITEATEAGADLEHVRHAATHSNIAMTQRYSRGTTEKIGNVMDLRSAHRNKKRTDGA